MILDIIFKILRILFQTIVNIALTYLVIQWVRAIHEENKRLNQKGINSIKKQAYKEILKSLDDKLCDCAIMSDGEYQGYYCSDIRDILRELDDEYEIYS